MLHIIDVSAYQGTTVPQVDAVIVKATEGSSYTSSKFRAQWASAAGRDHRGAYHFARPEESSYRDQADRFLDVVQPVAGESLWLDLEASGLSQSATNTWARNWGDYIAHEVGEQPSAYLGAGYASNGTGRDLAKHFRLWWYPQYPSAYQLAEVDVEALRAANRSEVVSTRTPIAAKTTRWPSTFAPWLPSGLTTGWSKPHLWQFTDNLNGYDASISPLTIDQLATGGGQKEEDVYGGLIPAGKGQQVNISFPRGRLSALGLVIDNTLSVDGALAPQPQAQVRYAIHRYTGSWQTGTAVVGRGPDDDKTVKTVIHFTDADNVDFVSLVRLDEGTTPVGWDMS